MSKFERRIDARQLKAQAYGQWLGIFQYICPGVFDEAIQNLGSHVTCPFHGGEEDFRFIAQSTSGRSNSAQTGVAICTCGVFSDGFEVLMRASNLSFKELLREVDTYLNGHPSESSPRRAKPKVVIPTGPSPEEIAARKAKNLERLRAIWNVATRVSPATATYYKARGIDPLVLSNVRDLRQLHRLGYYDKVHVGEGEEGSSDGFRKIGSFPALLGLMRDAEGSPVSIHRSWLSEDKTQKAPVKSPRKLTRSVSVVGAAIRLFVADGEHTLGLAEGVETALAVRELSQKGTWSDVSEIPVWACFSESNIRNFQIPSRLQSTLKRIIVFADNDERSTGVKAGESLKERIAQEFPSIEVIVRPPNVMGWDWLDYMVNKKQENL